MSYSKDFLASQGKFENFVDGEFMLRTFLKLGLSHAEEAAIADYDMQHDRGKTVPLEGRKLRDEAKSVVERVVGEEFRERITTKVSSKGTIYGVQQNVNTSFSLHSTSGMDRQMLNENGEPNYAALTKRLRELATNVELKEQRVNDAFNTLIVTDFYDNATALLFVGLQMMYKLRFLEKNTKYKDTFLLNVQDLETLKATEQGTRRAFLRDALCKSSRGMFVAENDPDVDYWVEAINAKVLSFPPKEISKDGQMVENPAYRGYNLRLPYEYWQMYKYDDGHSVSGTTFGDGIGFRLNKWKIPGNIDKIPPFQCRNTKILSGNIPNTPSELNKYASHAGFIKCSGMSPKELAIIDQMLGGNVRNTPFLVDQDVCLKQDEGDKYGILGVNLNIMSGISTEEEVHITERDVAKTIAKFVSNHRYHGDFEDAAKALRYWLAQPSTETVESHWWLHVKRTLDLPVLGLKRAVLNLFLSGQASGVTQQSLDSVETGLSANDSLVLESLFSNACWYWGEYLLKANTKDTMNMVVKMGEDLNTSLTTYERSDALVSAVCGVAISRARSVEQGTYVTCGIENYFTQYIPFGKIDIPHLSTYGYVLDGKKITTNTLVAPGCCALVTGLAGSLILNTPYGANFTMNPGVFIHKKFSKVVGMNYHDLWAMSVIARWQGYDLHYKHPTGNKNFTSYAANDVSVAAPPVTPTTLLRIQSYEISTVEQRDRCFGSSPENLVRARSTWYWSRQISLPLRTCEFTSAPCATDIRSSAIRRDYGVSTDALMLTAGHIMANYDISVEDFRVSYPRPGLVPEGRDAPSDSLAREQDSTPQTFSALGQDASASEAASGSATAS